MCVCVCVCVCLCVCVCVRVCACVCAYVQAFSVANVFIILIAQTHSQAAKRAALAYGNFKPAPMDGSGMEVCRMMC
jgi:hypothetical protein